MRLLGYITLLLGIVSCSDSTISGNAEKSIEQDTVIANDVEHSVDAAGTHLLDTLQVDGNTIVILRPDSTRFQSYVDVGEEWIYEVDSDFGFGVAMALDSVRLDGVRVEVTDKRFISASGCLSCPMLIDRDTIDYGLLLLGTDSKLQMDQNIYGFEYYLQLIRAYYSREER